MLRNLITLRKRYMPPPARNLSQLTGVSSVTFHIVDQAVSITSSQIPAWDKNSEFIELTSCDKGAHQKLLSGFFPLRGEGGTPKFS